MICENPYRGEALVESVEFGRVVAVEIVVAVNILLGNTKQRHRRYRLPQCSPFLDQRRQYDATMLFCETI